ncbi:MAG: lysophospholipase [Alphaproteobacteria bacterium]
MRSKTGFALVLALVLVLSLAGACAPKLAPPGSSPTRPMLTDGAYVAADGTKLEMRMTRPQGKARAVVVAVHGFNDYSNAFTEAAEFWSKRGIIVYAYDQRGFGTSLHRGMWPGMAALRHDLKAIAGLVARRHPGLPLYLVGVSMGGAVVMVTLAEDAVPEAHGAILVAPAVWGWRHLGLIPRISLRIASHTMPWLRFTGQGLGIKPSDNIEMLRRLSRDRRVIKKTRVDAIYGLVNLMSAAYAAAAKLKGPVFVLYGASDEIVPRRAVLDMVAKLRSSANDNATIGFYPKGHHMLLRDLGADEVLGDIDAWIKAPAQSLPSGADTRARSSFGRPKGPDS